MTFNKIFDQQSKVLIKDKTFFVEYVPLYNHKEEIADNFPKLPL